MKKNSEAKTGLRFQNGTLNLKSQIVTSSLKCQNGISRSDVFMQDTGELENQIRLVRGQYVILDYELAKLYGVGTGALNRAVKRNSTRFPSDFMFQLTKEECENLKCQFGISSWGGSRFQPYAFTEHGVAMLSGVLKSPIAISVNIQIMRAFIAMRNALLRDKGMLAQIDAVNRRQTLDQVKNEERFGTIFDALDRGNLLPQGILETGAEFDAFRFVTRLVESAKKEIVLIDPYSDASTLEVLAKKAKGVKVRLICKATNWSKPTATEIAKFNKQYKGLTVERSDNFHDRFVIIDGAELYNLGSSINSLGRRLTTYTTRDPKEIAKVLANV